VNRCLSNAGSRDDGLDARDPSLRFFITAQILGTALSMKPLLSARYLGFLVLLGYVLFFTFMGRFSPTDEVFFKAAGREWASHGRFAAPELTNCDLFPPDTQLPVPPETVFCKTLAACSDFGR